MGETLGRWSDGEVQRETDSQTAGFDRADASTRGRRQHKTVTKSQNPVDENIKHIGSPIAGSKPTQSTDECAVCSADADECPICLEPLAEKKAAKTRCGHRFHVDCLEEHLFKTLAVRPNCPICRTR